MRKLLFLIVLFLFLVSTSQAQEPYKVYLPLMLKDTLKNSWQIITPVASSNYVLNPSAETTGNFATVGSATITRSTTYQKYGLTSYRVQTTAKDTGLSLTLSTLTNAGHWMTFRVRGTLPRELRLSIGGASRKAVFIEKIDDYWNLYGAFFSASESSGRTSASIVQVGAGSADFYVDGIQIEPLTYWTTYVDGTQEGCEWNGAEHASTSSRSGESLAGGTPQDLYQQYKFFVERIIGAGAATQTLNTDSYALLPGGELNSIKVQPRQFTIIGKFITDSETELHDMRQELIKTLKLSAPGQPLKLRFNGGRVQKEIGVFYQGGLEGDLATFYEGLEPIDDNQWGEVKSYVEKASIQFQAPDPYWYEVGESAASLENASDSGLYSEQDTNESATFRLVAARLKSTGQWDELGPPASGGTYNYVYALAEDSTYLYIGGDFLNFDGIAAADNIVRYNKQTGVYSAMGTGANDSVLALATMPNGDLIAAGNFTSMGGVAGTAYIARWTGSAWTGLSTGMDSNVNALIVGLDGTLYATGNFATAGGVAAVFIARWNGAAWSALGSGLSDLGTALAVGPDGAVYVGGLFALAGGVANTVRIAKWDGSAWTPLGTGMTGGFVQALAVDSTGLVYAGGTFTAAGGVSASRIAVWNGLAWSALGSGANNDVSALSVGIDGTVYASGFFTSIGGLTLADRVARWNGYTWAHLDIDLPGSASVTALVASKYADPVVRKNYSLYLGFNTTGTGSFAGKTTVANDGNVPAFPRIVYSRSSGTFATIETLRNERTGKELLFDYSLANGESLTTDLAPTRKSIVSSFFGPRLDAVLPNSDFGTWQLLPDDNNITSFVSVSGGPALGAYLLWRDTYDGWD